MRGHVCATYLKRRSHRNPCALSDSHQLRASASLDNALPGKDDGSFGAINHLGSLRQLLLAVLQEVLLVK